MPGLQGSQGQIPPDHPIIVTLFRQRGHNNTAMASGEHAALAWQASEDKPVEHNVGLRGISAGGCGHRRDRLPSCQRVKGPVAQPCPKNWKASRRKEEKRKISGSRKGPTRIKREWRRETEAKSKNMRIMIWKANPNHLNYYWFHDYNLENIKIHIYGNKDYCFLYEIAIKFMCGRRNCLTVWNFVVRGDRKEKW